jgi:hypothetical protein
MLENTRQARGRGRPVSLMLATLAKLIAAARVK